jgi:hypothetical protein
MTARTAAELPTGEGRWAYEPKMDGFRCAAYRQPARRDALLTGMTDDVAAQVLDDNDGPVRAGRPAIPAGLRRRRLRRRMRCPRRAGVMTGAAVAGWFVLLFLSLALWAGL